MLHQKRNLLLSQIQVSETYDTHTFNIILQNQFVVVPDDISSSPTTDVFGLHQKTPSPQIPVRHGPPKKRPTSKSNPTIEQEPIEKLPQSKFTLMTVSCICFIHNNNKFQTTSK